MMKYFCFVLTIFFLISFGAQAGTPVSNTMAQKYFENCVVGSQKEGTMTVDSQKRFCACTAMNMQQEMSVEEIRQLSSNDISARQVLNKSLIKVNGPCMQYPVYDLLNKKCMADVGNSGICNCLSNRMAKFTKEYTAQNLPALLEENPEIYDPVTPIVESPEFQKTQQSIAISCATNPNQK